jgi:hypothetical protein
MKAKIVRFLRNHQNELLLTVSLLFGIWNFLEAKTWRAEFIARPRIGVEFGKFVKSSLLDRQASFGSPRPILSRSGKLSLVYIVGVADCGQAMSELRSVLPSLATSPLEVSLLLFGASKAEAAQLYRELEPNLPRGLSFSLVECEACRSADIGFRTTPYRLVADFNRRLIVEESVVQFREESAAAVTESLVRAINTASR